MKRAKHIGILFLSLLAFIACDDTTETLGIEMLSPSDFMNTHTNIYEVQTRSYLAGSQYAEDDNFTPAVYAKTSTGYIGRFTDKEFGEYEAGFLTQLNCTENFSLPQPYDAEKKTGTMAGDTTVACQLVVYYSTWFGDSLNACRMTAYELNEKLEKNAYTNIDPTDYYDPNDKSYILGRKAYSAYDPSIPDSVRNATDSYGNSTFYPSVVFPLDRKEFGDKRILEKYRNEPDKFKDADTFIKEIFKGVYLRSDYGDGTILYVDRVDLQMQFCFHYFDEDTGLPLKQEDGKDSVYYSMQTVFASTKEVVQTNQFFNSDQIKEKAEESEHTYLKSPAGIFTEATLPYDEIYNELSNDTINAVKLNFKNFRQNNAGRFTMEAPKNVLLIRKQDEKDFFEKNQLPDNITSYTVAHNNVGTNQYTFSNISRLVTTCINEKKAKEEAGETVDPDWNKVLLIPVTVTYDTSSSTNTIISIQHDLKPSYAELYGGESNPLDLEVIHTSFGKTTNK